MDLIPVGYTPLPTAFGIFRDRKPLGECKAVEELRNPFCLSRFGHEHYIALFDEVVIFERQERNAFLDEVREGRLKLFVSVAEATSVAIIPTEIWNMGDHYVEMTFRAGEFRLPPYGDWPKIDGRTPLVDSSAFQKWLGEFFSRRLQRERQGGNCQTWLEGQMRLSPNARTSTKTALHEEAQQRWPGISKSRFSQAWRRAIANTGADAWAAGGAPRKTDRTKMIRETGLS